MALALMFLKTNNTSTANELLTPDTLYQLEAIRPDFLLLRVRNIICCMITLNHHYTVLGHSLIMWDSVRPTFEWVQQHILKVSHCSYIHCNSVILI